MPSCPSNSDDGGDGSDGGDGEVESDSASEVEGQQLRRSKPRKSFKAAENS
jgi:hypothetical protein